MLRLLKQIIPPALRKPFLPTYHFILSFIGALWYGFPSRNIKIIGITGTKGKSSTAEIINAILETAGMRTALASTIRFKIGSDSTPNMKKMTMPGRFFMQKFIRDAQRASCEWVIIEMTSEGVLQHRHRFINLDALIFTNISPEHIESHGSFENYVSAKLAIGRALETSSKKTRVIVANADDTYGPRFLALAVEHSLPFSLTNTNSHIADENGVTFTFEGSEITSPLIGEFSIYNILAAATLARAIGVSLTDIQKALKNLDRIPGRAEAIEEGQKFSVLVDYAHTKESLEALYKTFIRHKTICVLGNAGGGRDAWKRPEMGQVADMYCERIILTDEDPYDEDPGAILEAMRTGITNKKPEIIIDRREAIHHAIALAAAGHGDAVLITGKGTDPYIMRANGAREAWSDAQVARDALRALHKTSNTH